MQGKFGVRDKCTTECLHNVSSMMYQAVFLAKVAFGGKGEGGRSKQLKDVALSHSR
eukprot:m.214160 g.214160  ORF g.214160 m.214160 type:complete len:56 (-) comp15097_c1_seq5:244-411(-)